jgi:UTP--glucose-1-phosphate uridylyltransferase
MPVLNRPVLHYVLADLVAVGIHDIAIIVDRGDRAIRQYLDGAPDVAADLERRGWEQKFEPFAAAYAELAPARFTIIEQDVTTGDYGTAVPARLARDFVADRPCFYVSGDDLLTAPDGGPNADDLGSLRSAADGCWASMQVTTVPAELRHRYGMVELVRSGGRDRLGALIEKSANTSGIHANISRYYLTPKAYGVISGQRPNPDTGEVMITDALRDVRDRGGVGVSIARGEYFDCGSLDGWHRANVAMAQTAFPHQLWHPAPAAPGARSCN